MNQKHTKLTAFLVFAAVAILGCHPALGAYSSLIQTNLDGTLNYIPDARGNIMPDYSYTGYKNTSGPLPTGIPVYETLTPQAGDNRAYIQAAIDRVGNRALVNGFRGTVHLTAGIYEIWGGLKMQKDGVILKGAGNGDPVNGTVILHKGTVKTATIEVRPASIGTPVFSGITAITDDYVPVGAKSFHVASTAGLSVGQKLFVRVKHTQLWIDALALSGTLSWTPGVDAETSIVMQREIVAIDTGTNEVKVDGSVTTQIDKLGGYATGDLANMVVNLRVANVGVEDMILMSDYDRSEKDDQGYYNDVDHANRGVFFHSANDCWVQRCSMFFYALNMVGNWVNSWRITVQDCAGYDGVSNDTPAHDGGGMEYYFDGSGNEMFVQRVYARNARHSFIMNGNHSGNAFLHCVSDQGRRELSTHQRWTAGSIFDNVYSASGFQHKGSSLVPWGQESANCAMWNTTSEAIPAVSIYAYALNNPPGNLAQNWAIGGLVAGQSATPVGNLHSYGGPGFSESTFKAPITSTATFVEPTSLFLAQLDDRLGTAAVDAMIDPLQRVPGQAMYDKLRAQYAGIPEFGDPKDPGLTWLSPPAPTYLLMVINGTGDGSYVEGAAVAIAADLPGAGQAFDAWTGDTSALADPNAANTTVTMPAAAVTVTATYEAVPTYTLYSDVAGPGSVAPPTALDVTSGATTQVIYTANTGFMISSLTSDDALVPAAIGQPAYTATHANVQGDISNRVIFAWNGSFGGGTGGMIVPGSVTSSRHYTGPGGTALDDQAFNGVGLSGDLHNDSWTLMWLASPGPPAGQWIKVDLNGVYTLDHLRVWNYNQPALATRGIQQADIYVALTDPGNNVDQSGAAFDPTGWTLVTPDQFFNIAPGNGGGLITNTDPNISLGGVPAAFLALRVDSNHGFAGNDSDFGVAEIQIYESSGLADQDGDGLPSDWETAYGLDPDDDGSSDFDQGADGDPDHDGATNEEELIADTDPDDPDSVLAVKGLVVNPDGSVDVSYPSSGARDYYLSGSDNLPSAGSWTNVAGPSAGTGASTSQSDAGPAGDGKTYRVEVTIP